MKRGSKPGTGASGLAGVSFHKVAKLWKAYVHEYRGYKQPMYQKVIGYFYTAQAAHEAREAYLKDGTLPQRIGRGARGRPRPRCIFCTKTLRRCECESPELEVRL